MIPLRDSLPSRNRPVVTGWLIALNALVFLFELSLGPEGRESFVHSFGMTPDRFAWSTLLTSMFLHGGWLHLAGNMLFLWIYGDNLEEELGHLGFLAFYLATGLAAAGLQTMADLGSQIPMVGASGAIAGVMGGYLLLFPRAKVDVLFVFLIFFRIFAIPAWIVLGLWFALQIFSGLNTPGEAGGVAYWAHAGGFIAGLALTLPVWLRRGARGYWQATSGKPPHPETHFPRSNIPLVPRRRR